jgi:DNA-binding transcriptional ArsR family regulator
MGQGERGDAKKQRRKVPAQSLRTLIVAACNRREVTPREIAEQERIDVAVVGYHFRALEKEGYLHVSRKEPARGFMRHYYVADRQKVITDEEFGDMTAEEQYEVSEAVLRDFLSSCKEALEAGTLDARSDSHLSWSPLALDEQGWRDLMSELARMLERSFEIQAEALTRLRKSGAEPIPTIFALAGFEGAAPVSLPSEAAQN